MNAVDVEAEGFAGAEVLVTAETVLDISFLCAMLKFLTSSMCSLVIRFVPSIRAATKSSFINTYIGL